MASILRGLERSCSLHTAYSRSENLENPVVNSLPVSPRYTTWTTVTRVRNGIKIGQRTWRTLWWTAYPSHPGTQPEQQSPGWRTELRLVRELGETRGEQLTRLTQVHNLKQQSTGWGPELRLSKVQTEGGLISGRLLACSLKVHKHEIIYIFLT